MNQLPRDTLPAPVRCNEEACQPQALLKRSQIQACHDLRLPGYPALYANTRCGTHMATVTAVELVEQQTVFRWQLRKRQWWLGRL
ncbi:hypothetical protein IQ22_02319 [Pseudomonas duriflava]|uniref:Uncharacterized protein n=1 Tax=Pseudomonas duriflava TaxID=459528 RepID=A0A562QAH9_9PSED|nr:hypothetical protein IQ22_02319 [Pseudomonas duriflava]